MYFVWACLYAIILCVSTLICASYYTVSTKNSWGEIYVLIRERESKRHQLSKCKYAMLLTKHRIFNEPVLHTRLNPLIEYATNASIELSLYFECLLLRGLYSTICFTDTINDSHLLFHTVWIYMYFIEQWARPNSIAWCDWTKGIVSCGQWSVGNNSRRGALERKEVDTERGR